VPRQTGSTAPCMEAGRKLGMSCIGLIVVPLCICGFGTPAGLFSSR
jgi:hypothetical protein